jgi:hypothetical protein
MNVLGTAVTIGMENAQNAIDGIPVFNLTPVLTSIAEGYNVAVSSVITSPVESLSGLLSTFAASVTTSAVNAETAITKVLTALDMIGNYNDTVTNARATNDMHMQEKAAEYTMTALKMGSGKLPTDLRYDLTGDGLVDAGDAILWKAISEGKRKWSSFGLPTFAEGGIAIGPSIAGEGRYREAIIPLPDGRNVPVVMQGSADNKETVAELKETNRQLAASIRVLQAGFTQLVEQVASGNQNGKVIAQKTTLKAAA